MSDTPSSHEGIGSIATVDETTKVSSLQIKVNGIGITITERIGIRELLIKAKGAGAIEGVIEEYVIERVSEEGQHDPDENITVRVDEEFLAVPTGATTVAQLSVIA